MSSPAAPLGPTSVAMASQGSRSTNRPPTANGVGPSTPAAAGNVSTPRSNATPSTMGNNASFLSPNAGRFGGKYIGKSPATGATGTPTPAPGSGESPALIGLDSGAPNMSFSMSSLGLGLGLGLSGSAMGGSSSGKLDEAERRRRLENVLSSLESRSGIISQEAVSRLGRKWGLELYEEVEDTKLLTLGGTSFALDVYFEAIDSPDVDRVALHFHGLNDEVVEHAPRAARILQDDLKTSKDLSRINAKLAGFADNLERLSRLDKLSITGASCFEAITGIYTSLHRLYEYEQGLASSAHESESTGTSDAIDRDILCNRSGIPRMHTRQRVGLVLDYWMHRHLLPPETTIRDDGDMAPDDSGHVENHGAQEDEIHSVVIECEYHPQALFPRMRVSSDWLAILKEDSAGHATSSLLGLDDQEHIQWLEPPAPQISTVEPNPMAADSVMAQTQVHARFMAHLEPPVVLPLQVAIEVFASVGVDLSQDPGPTSVWDNLLLSRDHDYDAAATAAAHSTPLTPRAHHVRYVSSLSGTIDPTASPKEPVRWDTQLYVNRPELAIKVEKIPFSHPREVLHILPRLRQHIILARLLKSCFSHRAQEDSGKDYLNALDMNGSNDQKLNIRHQTIKNGTTKTTTMYRAPRGRLNRSTDNDSEISGLFKSSLDPTTDASQKRVLAVTLSQGGPNPRLTVKLPTSKLNNVRRVFRIDILQNGILQVSKNDSRGTSDEEDMEKIAKALSTCEDLCVWAQWLS